MKNIIKTIAVAVIAMTLSYSYAQDAPKMEKKTEKVTKSVTTRDGKVIKKSEKIEKSDRKEGQNGKMIEKKSKKESSMSK